MGLICSYDNHLNYLFFLFKVHKHSSYSTNSHAFGTPENMKRGWRSTVMPLRVHLASTPLVPRQTRTQSLPLHQKAGRHNQAPGMVSRSAGSTISERTVGGIPTDSGPRPRSSSYRTRHRRVDSSWCRWRWLRPGPTAYEPRSGRWPSRR